MRTSEGQPMLDVTEVKPGKTRLRLFGFMSSGGEA